MIPTKLLPLELASPKTGAEWLDEPDLMFANGNLSPDPKVGIPLYGPRSLGTSRHRSEIHIGFIGTSDTVAKAKALYEQCSRGINGNDDYEPFPACNQDEGFRCELTTELTEIIRQHEYDLILDERKKRQKFETLLGVLQQKMNLITGARSSARLHRRSPSRRTLQEVPKRRVHGDRGWPGLPQPSPLLQGDGDAIRQAHADSP